MSLYKVNSGDLPMASDLDQLVDALTGANDVGTVSLIGPIAAPPSTYTATAAVGSGPGTGSYMYRLTYVSGYQKTNGSAVYVQGETGPSGAVSVTTTTGNNAVTLGSLPTPWPTGVLGLRIYRTPVGGADGAQKLVTTLYTPQASYTDTTADTNLGAAYPTTNTTGTNLSVGGTVAVNGSGTSTFAGTVQAPQFYVSNASYPMLVFQVPGRSNVSEVRWTATSSTDGGMDFMVNGVVAANLTATGVLSLQNNSIPAISFKTTQPGSQEWRWAGGYNDANTISLVDVTGNFQALRVSKSGDLYTGRGNAVVTPNSSVARIQNAVTSFAIPSGASTGWQKLTTVSFPVAFGSGNISSITVQLQITGNYAAVAGGLMPQNVTATGFDMWGNVQSPGATFYYNYLAFGQVV